MLQLNKYLKEVGIDENYWLFKQSSDERYKPDEEGFVAAEYWNLDATLAMIIYSSLRYFKDYCNYGHPGSMSDKQWDKCLDDMITAFELLVREEDYHETKIQSKNKEKKIKYGLRLFAKYFRALWY